MSDPCNGPFMICNPETAVRTVHADYAHQYTHTVNRILSASWEGLTLGLSKTIRTFSMSYQGVADENFNRVIRDTTSEGSPLMDCKNPSSNYQHSLSESCLREQSTLLYFDPFYKVLLLKRDRQQLTFIKTSDEMAAFRGKWGNTQHHKFVILNSDVHAEGTEEFVLYWLEDGVMQTRVLNSEGYSFNPMPETSGMGTWGLYGNEILKSCPEAKTNVAMILVVPQPQSLAIPLDCDINEWGFYDYLAKEEGFSTTDLALQDGGMDFFYPAWCRNMLADSIWREEADRRYLLAWGPQPRPTIVPTQAYSCPRPAYSQAPCGGCVNVSQYSTFWSFAVEARSGVKLFNEVRIPGTDGIQVLDPAALLGETAPLNRLTYFPSIGLK